MVTSLNDEEKKSTDVSYFDVSECLIKLLFEKLQVQKKSYEFEENDDKKTQINITIPVMNNSGIKFVQKNNNVIRNIGDFAHKIDVSKWVSPSRKKVKTFRSSFHHNTAPELLEIKVAKKPF